MGLFRNSANRQVQKVIKNLQRQGVSSESYKERKHCGSCRHFVHGNYCNWHEKKTIPAEYCLGYRSGSFLDSDSSTLGSPELENVEADLAVIGDLDDYNPYNQELEKMKREYEAKASEIEECFLALSTSIGTELKARLQDPCLQFVSYVKSLQVATIEELIQASFAEMKRYQEQDLPRLAEKIVNEGLAVRGCQLITSREIASRLTIDTGSVVSALTDANGITERDALMAIAKTFSGLAGQVVDVCADWIVEVMHGEIQALTSPHG